MADPLMGFPGSQPGGSLTDLVNTQKGGVLNLSQIAAQAVSIASAIINALPVSTTTASPKATGVNNLGTTGTSVLASSSLRHGLIVCNPATTNVICYVYPTLATPAPTLASTGGSIPILPGGFSPFPPSQFPNFNAGLSAFCSTGTNNPLTFWEFF